MPGGCIEIPRNICTFLLCGTFPADFQKFLFRKCFPGKSSVSVNKLFQLPGVKRDGKVIDLAGQIQAEEKFVRKQVTENIIKAAGTVTTGGEDHSVIILFFKFFQNRFGKRAHIRMHQGICLGESCDMRFHAGDVRTESLK